MKLFNKFLFVLAGIMFIFAACEEPIADREPSPLTPETNQGVYFPSSNKAVYEMEPTAPTQFDVVVARTDSTNALDLPIVVDLNDEDVFVVPETVSFAAGEKEATFTVSFPTAGEGTTYNLKLSVRGDEFDNPYSSTIAFYTTNITRIKWEKIEEPMVYVDGTIGAFYGVQQYPMYVDAEKAELGDVIRYRFKNVYKLPSVFVSDEDGIFDGYPYNKPGQFDEDNDYYTIIEINEDDEVVMFPHEIGLDWGSGMISIGTIYGYLSTNIDAYPLGSIEDDIITFPLNSLYISEADYNNGGKYPAGKYQTYIYKDKETYLAANMKIDDFNEEEYEVIEGAVSEFSSEAFEGSWAQAITVAVDIDSLNPDSEFKNLYFLPDLYADDYGLAFYYKEGASVKIPEKQPTGRKMLGKDIFVSPSDKYESSVVVNSKGVTVYTLGLTFHFKDGTVIGEFPELFFYSEDFVSYDKADFLGDFLLTGPSQFAGEDDAEMEIFIEEGAEANTFLIKGVDFAKEIIADFDPETSTMSIAPQALADYGAFDITLYTTTIDGKISATAAMDFMFNMEGDLVLAASSEADGYLLESEAAGGYVDGYYDLVFSPIVTDKAAKVKAQSTMTTVNVKKAIVEHSTKSKSAGNFAVQNRKISAKDIKKLHSGQIVF